MNHHQEAWEKVKPHLFGEVVEVTRTVPWGFKEDRKDIVNISVRDFLNSTIQTDTILLHILSGEGEDKQTVCDVLSKAKNDAVKVVILEHTGRDHDVPELDYLDRLIPNDAVTDWWGRNQLWAFTTFDMLELHQLSDEYLKENLQKSFVMQHDEGIDKQELIYTHTSEEPINFDLPDGTIYWVIGGGLAYESMQEKNRNILFDSILKQVLYCAYKYEEKTWKLERLWKNDVQVSEDYRQWRVVRPNGVKPDKIIHKGLDDLKTDDLVYVSTVDKEHWKHLARVIDCFTNRDTCVLVV